MEEEYESRSAGQGIANPTSATKHSADSDSDDPDGEDGEEMYGNQDEFEELEIDAADEEALAHFMSSEAPTRRTLADIIMEKIQEREAQGADPAAAQQQGSTIDPKVEEVYASVGKLLSRYRAGKLPKAFKIIPSLRQWEEVLYITDPWSWSPHAMRAATRIFASNLNPKMAQRFYALVLLPTVREDIQTFKRLNYHYYMALKKALYKQAPHFQ